MTKLKHLGMDMNTKSKIDVYQMPVGVEGILITNSGKLGLIFEK